MKLFVYLIADIVHLIKIIIICNMFFKLKKSDNNYNGRMLTVAAVVMLIVSVFTYLCDNKAIGILAYIVTIVVLLSILYKEKVSRITIFTIWIIFAMSMIDTMSTVLFDISTSLVRIKCDEISKIVVATMSLMLVYVVGRIYSTKYNGGIKVLGVSNSVAFTILAVVDAFIVTIIAYISVNENQGVYRVLYSVAFILVILGMFIQLGAVILLFMQRNVYKEKKQITEKYLNEQKNHYEYLDKREKETKKFRHDLRNHMQMLSNFARNHQYDDFDKYLETIEMKIESFGNIITVHNGIVDAVINQFYSKAIQNNIKMEVRGRFPEDCAIDAYDLCTIFSNVLSNALEAAIETDEKLVTVECRYTDKNIIVVVTNSFINDGNETIRTRKDDLDYHGYGLENTKDSIEKYHGVFDIETKDNLFILKILFNYIEKRDYENRNNRG